MTSPSCFVAMPLSTRPDEMEFYRDEAYWQRVFSHLIEPAVVRAGYRVLAPGRVGSEHITSEIVRDICTADMMVCDVSSANANVFFEMGLRTSLDLPVAIVRGQYSSPLPFDIHAINCYTYRFQIPIEDEIEALSQHLGNAMRTSSGRNTMWKVYGAAYTARETVSSLDSGKSGMISGESARNCGSNVSASSGIWGTREMCSPGSSAFEKP